MEKSSDPVEWLLGSSRTYFPILDRCKHTFLPKLSILPIGLILSWPL